MRPARSASTASFQSRAFPASASAFARPRAEAGGSAAARGYLFLELVRRLRRRALLLEHRAARRDLARPAFVRGARPPRLLVRRDRAREVARALGLLALREERADH